MNAAPTTEENKQSDITARAAREIEDALEADAAQIEKAEDSETDDIDAILRAIEARGDPAARHQLGDRASKESTEAPRPPTLTPKADQPVQNPPNPKAAVRLKTPEDIGDDASADGTGTPTQRAAPHVHSTPKEAAPRKGAPPIREKAEDDLSRLMVEADHQMEKPDGQTRRHAFSQLRAAVAARRADHSLDDGAATRAKDAQAYRSDLADVVHARQTGSPGTHAQRQAGGFPPPLRLVAEQRVDQMHQRAGNRVQSKSMTLGPRAGFAAYADRHGAQTLPELLEAAASYVCFVEGRAQFSRPQLISRVTEARGDDMSRDDSLRCFGQLLRDGKITKVKGGWFTASDTIGYTPDRRANL